MELNQRLLKAIAVLFVASCALSYAIRGSNETFSEAFLVSTQSTEPNMFASSEPNMFASSKSRYVPLSPGKGYVYYHNTRCAIKDFLVKRSRQRSEEDCARACSKHPVLEDTCINKYFSYESRRGFCFHFDGVGDCEPDDMYLTYDSFKFVDYGKCDIDDNDELEGSGDDADSLQDCQKLCTKNDKCKAYQWFNDGIPPRNGRAKCTLYSDSTNVATCYKKENNQMVKVGDGWCMKPTDAFSGGSIAGPDINLEFCEDRFLKFEKLEYMDFIPGQCSWYGRNDPGAEEPGGFAVAVCENKPGVSYCPI